MTETCDFLIIGGGSAGCIIARRLAERTTGRIILLEAGPTDEGDEPAILLDRLDDQTPRYDWGYKATPIAGSQFHLDYSRAKILGGCGNHNDCAFLVPPDCDFDAWAAAGATSWSANDVAPYFRRIEQTIHIDAAADVSKHPLSQIFIDAGRELGLPEIDFRSQGIAPGVGWFPLNANGNLRQSSSAGYLHPVSSLPKHLEVWTGAVATRLILANGRAIGAETSRGAIYARREVTLTAGSLNTPQLMMVSGLGPAADLTKLGIPVYADLPGVGSNLLDHVAAGVVWETREPIAPWQITPYQATVLIKIDADAPAPDVLFHFSLRVREKYGEHPRYKTDKPAVKASPNVARARSRGRMSLRSANIADAPIIDLNYFSDPEGYDARVLLAALRQTRALASTKALGAALAREVSPGPQVVTDADLGAYMREVCETVYHPSGTCRMGSAGDHSAVVTPDLKVKGIEALRVCDASVFPTMVTVNINNTVMMIAEKAVDHILAG